MIAATEDRSNLVKQAAAMEEQAWQAQQLVDSHHYFLCAADLYQEAGAEDSARWAQNRANQCQRILARRAWD